MISVFIYGLDQFVVGDVSRELTPLLAKLYEVDEDEINFVAPNTMIFHKGMEQTSWNALVIVNLPLKVSVLQEKAAQVIFSALEEIAIHVDIRFQYYSVDHRNAKINPNYPRYISEDNVVNADSDHCCEDLEEGEENDQIYTGDIFENYSKNK